MNTIARKKAAPEIGRSRPFFYTDPVENPFRSSQEGRPQYDEVEFVRILIHGDRFSEPVQRVDPAVRARWPKEYKAFLAAQEPPQHGTPLIEWPIITRAQALELAHFRVRTVEQLSALKAAKLRALGPQAAALREQAKAYLDTSRTRTGPIARLVAENERLKADTARQADVIKEMGARLAALEGKTVNASDHP